jgi:hypothetical protein
MGHMNKALGAKAALVAVAALGATGAVGVGIGISTASDAGASSPFNPAGYVVPLTDAVSHQISLTVKVPTITCKKSEKVGDLMSASISGTTTGSAFDAAGVLVSMSCSGTTASYSVFGIVDNSHTTSTISVNPGDVLNIAVIASTSFETASFGDATTGQGSYVDGTGFEASQGSVDLQGGTGSGGFPKFRPVTFTQVKLDSKPIGRATPTVFDQLDAGGNTQIAASPLNTSGSAFTDTYVTNT